LARVVLNSCVLYMYIMFADGYVYQSFQLIKATSACGKSVSLQTTPVKIVIDNAYD